MLRIIYRCFCAALTSFICENIRNENGVTRLRCHNRFSDCCVALHPSAGISLEINGNARCCGGLLDLQQAVTCNVNSPRRSNSTSRRKSGEIFEVQLHASVNSNKNSCIIVYDKCIARYRWRQAAESQNENTSWHLMVSGGSNQLKQRKVIKHCTLSQYQQYATEQQKRNSAVPFEIRSSVRCFR